MNLNPFNKGKTQFGVKTLVLSITNSNMPIMYKEALN